MADQKETEFRRKFRAVMLGIAAGSAAFLAARYFLKSSIDIGLIVAGFFGFATGTFLWMQPPPDEGGK